MSLNKNIFATWMLGLAFFILVIHNLVLEPIDIHSDYFEYYSWVNAIENSHLSLNELSEWKYWTTWFWLPLYSVFFGFPLSLSILKSVTNETLLLSWILFQIFGSSCLIIAFYKVLKKYCYKLPLFPLYGIFLVTAYTLLQPTHFFTFSTHTVNYLFFFLILLIVNRSRDFPLLEGLFVAAMILFHHQSALFLVFPLILLVALRQLRLTSLVFSSVLIIPWAFSIIFPNLDSIFKLWHKLIETKSINFTQTGWITFLAMGVVLFLIFLVLVRTLLSSRWQIFFFLLLLAYSYIGLFQNSFFWTQLFSERFLYLFLLSGFVITSILMIKNFRISAIVFLTIIIYFSSLNLMQYLSRPYRIPVKQLSNFIPDKDILTKWCLVAPNVIAFHIMVFTNHIPCRSFERPTKDNYLPPNEYSWLLTAEEFLSDLEWNLDRLDELGASIVVIESESPIQNTQSLQYVSTIKPEWPQHHLYQIQKSR